MKVNMPFCILILAMTWFHTGLTLLTSVALGVNQYKALQLRNALPATPTSPAVSLEEEQEGNLVLRLGKRARRLGFCMILGCSYCIYGF